MYPRRGQGGQERYGRGATRPAGGGSDAGAAPVGCQERRERELPGLSPPTWPDDITWFIVLNRGPAFPVTRSSFYI